jgi:hypothetical protein
VSPFIKKERKNDKFETRNFCFLFKRNSWPIKKMKFSVVELKERDVTVLRFLTSCSYNSDTFFKMIHLLNVVVSIFNISPLQPVPHGLHAHPFVSYFVQISQVDRKEKDEMAATRMRLPPRLSFMTERLVAHWTDSATVKRSRGSGRRRSLARLCRRPFASLSPPSR